MTTSGTKWILDGTPIERLAALQAPYDDAPGELGRLNVDTALLTGSYRIGVGDIRLPLVNSYAVINLTTVTVQDNRAGAWTYQRLDTSLSPAPRYQFKLAGTLTDPQRVDFYIEGY